MVEIVGEGCSIGTSVNQGSEGARISVTEKATSVTKNISAQQQP